MAFRGPRSARRFSRTKFRDAHVCNPYAQLPVARTRAKRTGMGRNEDDGNETRRRLRIPAALAVAFVGTSASVAMTFAGCRSGMPEPVDGRLMSVKHDAGVDASDDGSVDAMVDAGQTFDDAPHT